MTIRGALALSVLFVLSACRKEAATDASANPPPVPDAAAAPVETATPEPPVVEDAAVAPPAESGPPAGPGLPVGGLLAGFLGGAPPAAAEEAALGRMVERAAGAPAGATGLRDGVDGPPPEDGAPVRVEMPAAPAGMPDAVRGLCTSLVPTVAGCVARQTGSTPTGEEIARMLEACGRDLGPLPEPARLEMTACLERGGCDAMMECLLTVDEAWRGSPGGPETPPSTGPTDMFGPAPDPARVAALPPTSRDLCEQLALRFDACWEDLIGLTGSEIDDTMRASADAMRPQIRDGLRNICLGSALDDPATFAQMEAARPCLLQPCSQMLTCIAGAQPR